MGILYRSLGGRVVLCICMCCRVRRKGGGDGKRETLSRRGKLPCTTYMKGRRRQHVYAKREKAH